jgi:hypothetical protein
MPPTPLPKKTPVPGGPSNLATPGAKQHVDRVQFGTNLRANMALGRVVWHGWRGAKGINEGRTDGAKSSKVPGSGFVRLFSLKTP